MIRLNDFVRMNADIGSDLVAVMSRVLASGWYVLGDEVVEFERQLALDWNMSWAVGCGNGMDAIEIGLRILALKPGDKVLTTPLSAFATTLAIIRAGGVPVFVDTDEIGNIDLDQVEAALSGDATIRHMVPVHLYGIPVDLKRLSKIKKAYKLKIVEDCAQAIGAEAAGMRVGSVGDIAAVSFYPTKNLGAIGDGGALLGTAVGDKRKALMYRNYGQSEKYIHQALGMNSRLDEIQAAVLSYLLCHRLEKYIQRRRQIAELYIKHISNKNIILPNVDANTSPVWHLFPVQVVGDRVRLMDYLARLGIETAVHYPRLITDQLAMKSVPYEICGNLERACFIAEHEVSLPIHAYMTDEEAGEVIKALHSYTSE